MAQTHPKLNQLRQTINEIDSQIVKLLNQRVNTAKQIYQHKQANNLPLTDKNREQTINKQITKASATQLADSSLQSIYQTIITHTKKAMSTQPVYYLGPPGTFSHQVARQLFPNTSLTPVKTIKNVIERTTMSPKSRGVVPLENKLIGLINETHAALQKSGLTITKRATMPLSMHLCTNAPTKSITHVYSKQQALDQCSKWLQKNYPQAKLVATASTTAGLTKIRQNPQAAIICSQAAIDLHQLNTHAKNIQNDPNNYTVFGVISHEAG